MAVLDQYWWKLLLMAKSPGYSAQLGRKLGRCFTRVESVGNRKVQKAEAPAATNCSSATIARAALHYTSKYNSDPRTPLYC